MAKYEHTKIEAKWNKVWAESKLFETDEDGKKTKFYCLDMFPYPSGAGLHVGHPKGYIATDVFSRMKRLQGHKVLHPMGWDAFGLPTENYAIKHKVNPRQAAEENIKKFRSQLDLLGFNYDWDREINTTDPEYYKWTQWIFLKLFEKGLAYQSWEPINWCPSCKTGLSMEDLEDGKCERCGGEVEQKPMRQWVLKITDYADRLLEDLKLLDWEEQIIEQQRNWIGRSEGAKVKFEIVPPTVIPAKAGIQEEKIPGLRPGMTTGEYIEVFTTRIDTLYGATFMVLAPEHDLVEKITTSGQKKEIEKYISDTKKKTELQRQQEKKKTGAFTGAYAVNPVNGEKLPIWISDYVLMGYGTGAIMAVPAHDGRDNEFAKKFNIPIKEVVVEQVNERAKDGVFRKIAIGIVENSKGEFLIQSKTVDGETTYSIPGGGIDEGETEEAAVLRELREETGYTSFSSIRKIGTVEANYYHSLRKVNRRALATCFSLKLKDDTMQELELTETEKLGEIKNFWTSRKKAIELLSSQDASSGEDYPLLKRYLQGDVADFTGYGVLINSGEYDGLTSVEAKEKIVNMLAKEGKAEKAVSYKIKDWVFSRQRYWGEPIPIVHCEKCGPVAVPEDQLPLTLPEVESYEPTGTGESPLAAITDWVNTTCPKCGGPAKRETDTMPQWAGSSWYYLRYIDPKNNKSLVDPKKEKEWMPVDLYVGGIEHATRHLLYARFWHKFLYDIKTVSTVEPFKKLIHVGLILAEDGRKMSKRWGNVINPDDIIAEYGADALRIYEMFMGPFTQAIAWNTDGVKGVRKFLEKVYDYATLDKWSEVTTPETSVVLNKTIKKVTEDIEDFKFNTAVSAFMIFINHLTKNPGTISRADFGQFLILLSPFAPYLTEEIWQEFGQTESIYTENWPGFDPRMVIEETVVVAVQVNGKIREQLIVTRGINEEDILVAAKDSAKVQKYLENTEIIKVIYVDDKLLSLVVK